MPCLRRGKPRRQDVRSVWCRGTARGTTPRSGEDAAYKRYQAGTGTSAPNPTSARAEGIADP
jgi:hypothetical protein